MPTPADDKPFVLRLLRLDETPGGSSFRPGARIALTPALRASGLLLSLPGEDLKSLLLVLTFVHPNGHIQPTLLELSQALRQPQGMTRARMRRLERFVWQGKPLLHEVRRESGLHGWTPSPRILGMEHAPQASDMPVSPSSGGSTAAGREAVIAHSRATYARPREEVEREIALANGWEWPPRTLGERQDELRHKAQSAEGSPPPAQVTEPSSDTANPSLPMNTPSPSPSPSIPIASSHADLRRDLAAWGVPAELIVRLLSDHDPARIRSQLDWLPLRNAHDPARFLVAAIQKDYAPPASVRSRQALEQAMRDSVQPAQTEEPLA